MALPPRRPPRFPRQRNIDSPLEVEWSAVEIFCPFDLDENAESFLLGVAILLGLNQARPNLFVDCAGRVDRRGSVEAGDAALGQHTGVAKGRFSEEHGDLRSVFQILVGCALPPLPQ